MKSGIIGYNPETGKTAIVYNGVRFYTADKSVIKMATAGNIAGAAQRWAGKTSTARALRQANKQATKPIYKNPTKSLFNKIFKEGKRERIGNTAQERLQFAKEYKKLTQKVNRYIEQAVTDDLPVAEIADRLPGALRERVNQVIREEVEKAYAAKGEVDDSDLENINDRITMEMDNFLIENPDIDIRYRDVIQQYAERPVSEVSELEKY